MKITDKKLHFSISYMLFSTMFLYLYIFSLPVLWIFIGSFLVTAGFGFAKELIFDQKIDWLDIKADAYGIIASAIIIFLLLLI